MAALLSLFVLTAFACGSKESQAQTSEQSAGEAASAEDLYGTWKGINGEISTLSLAKNGSYMDNAGDGLYISGTYTVDEAAQTLTVNESEYGMVFVYHYSLSNNQLTLQLDGGKARNFAKAK